MQASPGLSGASVPLAQHAGGTSAHRANPIGFGSRRHSGGLPSQSGASSAAYASAASNAAPPASGTATHRTTSYYSASNVLGPSTPSLPAGMQKAAQAGNGAAQQPLADVRESVASSPCEGRGSSSAPLGSFAGAARRGLNLRGIDRAHSGALGASSTGGSRSGQRSARLHRQESSELGATGRLTQGLTDAPDASQFGGATNAAPDTVDQSQAAARLVQEVRAKVHGWFAGEGTANVPDALLAPSMTDEDGASAGALDTQVQRVVSGMPPGYAIAPFDPAAAPAAVEPDGSCCLMQLRAETRIVGSVLVCTTSAQRDELAHRARQSAIFPPRLGLITPDAAAALCFSCSWTLADTLAENAAKAAPMSLSEATGVLIELVRVLEELHVSGFAAVSLSPHAFVKAGPVPRSHAWHLNCIHSVIAQGTDLPAHAPEDVRWLAPEQAAIAINSAATDEMPGGSDKRAAPGTWVVDSAADIFALGVVAYQLVTQRGYWGNRSRDDVLACLTGSQPMPQGCCEAPRGCADTDARKLLPLIGTMLRTRVPARPLAGEVMASLQALGGQAGPPPAEDTSFVRDDGSAMSSQVQRNMTQPMRICLALAKQEPALKGVAECVRTRVVNSRRVFQLERSVRLTVVVAASLAESAAVPVYPLRSTSHLVMEWGSDCGTATERSATKQGKAGSAVVEMDVEETLAGGTFRNKARAPSLLGTHVHPLRSEPNAVVW